MALVTIERSPCPSDSAEADELDTLDISDVNSPPKKRSRSGSALRKLKKLFNTIRFVTKLKPGFSESYFTVKGTAVILPQSDETAFARHFTKSHGSDDIQSHLQAMFSILRQQDTIKVAVRLEGPHIRYLAVVSCIGQQDTEESVLLGIDLLEKPTIGLVLPLWAHTHIRLDGDGGFCIHSDNSVHSFKPISVQAMWSALQTLNKVVKIAIEHLYTPKGPSHAWVGYYNNKLSKESFIVAKWNASGDRDNWYRSDKLYSDSGGQIRNVIPRPKSNFEHPVYTSAGEEDMHKRIRHELKNVMMTVDLEEVTCMFLRQSIEKKLHKDLNDYKSYIDTEMMEILGQMDAPSKILDYLYLGSEWNASNLEELQKTGVNHILNISCEIDNFFPGVLYYMNVREWDVEQSNLMRHWDDTYKYINKARKRGSKALVHCKMGISRSASTVIAFLMKEKKWSLNEAYEYTRSKRSIINPNPGFWKQLETYEGILKANMHRPKFDVIAILRPIKPVDDIYELPNTEASSLPVEIGKDHPDFGVSEVIHKEQDIETESVCADSTNDSLLKATETSPKKYFRYLEKHKNKIGDLSSDSSEETDSESSSSDDEDVPSHEDNSEKVDDHRDIARGDSEDGSHALFASIESPHVKIDAVGIQRNFFNTESKRSKSEGDKSLLTIWESFSPTSREGSVSKFKPDGSWIKPVNKVSETEVTDPDPVAVGVMHTKDVGLWMERKDDEMADLLMEESVSGEQQREVIIGDKDPDCNSPSGSKQSCLNVDQFTRENIPCSPGSVEKQKQSTEIKYGSLSSALNKKTDAFEISDAESPVNSAFVLVGKMEDANCGIQESENHDIHCRESQRMEVDVCEQSDICDSVGQSTEMEREEFDQYESTEPVHESWPPKESEDMGISVYEHKEDVPSDCAETKVLCQTKSNGDPTKMFVIESSTTSENDHQEKGVEFQISGNADVEFQTGSMKVSIPECQTGSVKIFSPEDVEIQSGSMKVYTGAPECQTGSMKVYSPEDVEIKTASMKIYSPECQTGSMKVYSQEDVDIQTDTMKLDSPKSVECQTACVKVYKYLGEELTVEEGLVYKNTLEIESEAILKIHLQPTQSESS